MHSDAPATSSFPFFVCGAFELPSSIETTTATATTTSTPTVSMTSAATNATHDGRERIEFRLLPQSAINLPGAYSSKKLSLFCQPYEEAKQNAELVLSRG